MSKANQEPTVMPLKAGEIVLFNNPDGTTSVEVRLGEETVWLSLNELADLFGVDKSGISRHLRNVFKSGELERSSTVAKFATVQIEGTRSIVREIEYYNLDAILSVGYRVNSSKATRFRIWANSILKEHLIKGYSFNQRRWNPDQIASFQQAIGLFPIAVQNLADRGDLTADESIALMQLVADYASSWVLLRQYDDGALPATDGIGHPDYAIDINQARVAIRTLKQELAAKGEVTALFGNERDGSLHRILGALYQTFGGEELYSTIEQKAAHLLYFVIKDHPFSDGNKRIGAFLFLHYLDKNNYLKRCDGDPKIDPAALVALALLIAESDPRQKNTIVQLIIHFLTE